MACACISNLSCPALPGAPPAGTHLIKHSCFRTLDRGGQFVLLGSAPDPKIQGEFNALQSQVGWVQGGVAAANGVGGGCMPRKRLLQPLH